MEVLKISIYVRLDLLRLGVYRVRSEGNISKIAREVL